MKMEYKTKSAIIGRKKRLNQEDTKHPCFISLFSMNDPHKSGKVPDKIVEFDLIDRMDVKGLDISYLLSGNDLVINNLESLKVEQDDNFRLYITGKQKK